MVSRRHWDCWKDAKSKGVVWVCAIPRERRVCRSSGTCRDWAQNTSIGQECRHDYLYDDGHSPYPQILLSDAAASSWILAITPWRSKMWHHKCVFGSTLPRGACRFPPTHGWNSLFLLGYEMMRRDTITRDPSQSVLTEENSVRATLLHGHNLFRR